jgi:hypothetical protein
VRYAPAPTAYQITDASGKTWQHADGVYLASWVADRNKAMAFARTANSPTGTPQVTGRKIGDLAIYEAGAPPLKGSEVRLIQPLAGFRWKVETIGLYPVTFEAIEYYLTPIPIPPQSVVTEKRPDIPNDIPSDPYRFGAKLNHARSQYYRKALVHDPALSALAAANSSKGWGHHGGHHGRENVGMGSLDAVMASWLASPAHASALLDPSLSRYGIAQANGIWTYVGAR